MSTHTHSAETTRSVNPFRVALLVGGLIAVGFGVAVLFWPAKTAVAVTGVLAVYAIAAGVVYIAVAAVARWQSTGSRIGHALLGVLFILAGAYAFASLQESAAFLALFVTVMIGVMWIVEGFTALFTLGSALTAFLVGRVTQRAGRRVGARRARQRSLRPHAVAPGGRS